MAQECGFFNAQLAGEEYDRVYLAEHFAAYFASFIGNGIFGHSMQKLEVMAQDSPNMSTKVLAGEGWINGYWYRNTDAYTLNHSVADGVLSRIDTIVLRWSSSERSIYLHVIEGTPSVNPIAPPIIRNSDYFDLGLARVTIPAGSIRITQAQIQDLRLNSDFCGLVVGLIDQIDLTGIFNQFEEYFDEFKEFYENDFSTWSETQRAAFILWVETHQAQFNQFVDEQEEEISDWIENQESSFYNWYNTHTQNWQEEFTEWFDEVKGQLSEDVAGRLQLEINEHEARLSNLEKMIIHGVAFAPAEVSTGEILATSNDELIVFEWPINIT